MMPELGQLGLIIALFLALLQAFVPLYGVFRADVRYQLFARPIAYVQSLFVAFSFAVLAHAFLVNDFSVVYVAENSNSHLPLFYRFAAVWGAHEGSILLWILVLSIWTSAFAYCSRAIPQDVVARVLAILGLLSVGFLLFILATSNPFLRLLPQSPVDGRDLNPMLQDIGLIIHPPLLYLGYVGFSVAFAFAIAALMAGRLDAAWAKWSRPWTLLAWSFLTAGITLGSWWAYRVLGWGGWWFWDPVENASFMPWLSATALLHSLIVSEKRGALKAWTVLLAIVTFSLSLLGTFLVRSGVLVSVHAFAIDPARGNYILKFLAIVIGGSLTLYAIRINKVVSDVSIRAFSRESFLLINNIFLSVACATVVLGTLYPLLLDVFQLGKISVGPPYFNRVFVPIVLLLALFMGLGPLSRWYASDKRQLLRYGSLVLSLSVLAVLLGFIYKHNFNWQVLLGLSAAFYILLATLNDLHLRRLKKLTISQAQWGMYLAHCGVAIAMIGVALTSAYHDDKDVLLHPGDKAEVAGYSFEYVGEQDVKGPNYSSAQATFLLKKDQQLIATLKPEKRFYSVQEIAMTHAAIDVNLFRDVYIALGNPMQQSAWTVRLYVKPFVRWIWFGGILIVFGGLLAAFDKRLRVKLKVQHESMA